MIFTGGFNFKKSEYISEFASSCIDISDGLIKDLGSICKLSKVGAKIFYEDIPITNDINDPRIKDVSPEVYDEQEKILLEIRDFMTDVRLFEDKVSKMLEKKPGNKKKLKLTYISFYSSQRSIWWIII